MLCNSTLELQQKRKSIKVHNSVVLPYNPPPLRLDLSESDLMRFLLSRKERWEEEEVSSSSDMGGWKRKIFVCSELRRRRRGWRGGGKETLLFPLAPLDGPPFLPSPPFSNSTLGDESGGRLRRHSRKKYCRRGGGGGEVEEKSPPPPHQSSPSADKVDFLNPSILVAEAFAHSKE